MNNPILTSWISFIEDIGVPPPSPPSPITVRKSWCPDGTRDPTRLKQKRPLLRNLLFEAIEGRIDLSQYPREWVNRKSFKKLFNLNVVSRNPSQDFERWVSENIDSNALKMIKDDHKELLKERFTKLVDYLEKINSRAAALESRYQSRKKEVNELLQIIIKIKSGPGHQNRMNNINTYKEEIVDSLGDALVMLKSIERALIEDMQEMVLDAMTSSLGDVGAVFTLPSLEGLLSVLETMPDFSSEEGLVHFEKANYATAIKSHIHEIEQRFSEITYTKFGVEKHLEDLNFSLTQGGGINFMANIAIGDGNKFAQANQTTNINSQKPE